MGEKKYKCTFERCNKEYATQKGLSNHIHNIHNVSHHIVDDDWDKDQIELAMELSMKEQYSDFIPDNDDVLKMCNANICVICGTSKSDIAFIDCGHMVTCSKCSEKIMNNSELKKKCPICRKSIKKTLKIFT
jgi:hypothetical protein